MNAVNVHQVALHDFHRVAERVAAVYIQCFSEEPWNEVFQAGEVIERMQKMLTFQDAILLVATHGEDILGTTVLYPLHYNAAVSANVGADHLGAMYCEELFVSRTYHRRGIGGRLFDTATGISMALGYACRILRTGADHEQAKRFYMSRGYRQIGVMQCRSRKRLNGTASETLDSRVLMLHTTPIPNSVPLGASPRRST
ncbi:MAG: GNAT family N-acetyltransferase [Pseudomonadota bacterium]